MSEGRITVEREAGGYVAMLGSFRFVLDGTTVGRLKRSESISVEAPCGHHELHLAISWCRSPSLELDLDQGEEVQIRCRPAFDPLTSLFVSVLWPKHYVSVELVSRSGAPSMNA